MPWQPGFSCTKMSTAAAGSPPSLSALEFSSSPGREQGSLTIMKKSAMDSSGTPTSKTPTPIIENTIDPATSRSDRLLSDWRISVLVLLGLWMIIYMAGISRPALLDDVDTVHAEAAREMLLRHDWVTLYTNGFRYLEKAPLLYWSLATSYRIFGISD